VLEGLSVGADLPTVWQAWPKSTWFLLGALAGAAVVFLLTRKGLL
jgi:hypothetical protein